jgi:thiamine kinase-like enzyme
MVDHADTVGHTLTAHPEQFDEVMRKFVDTYQIIHHTNIKKRGAFASLKDTWTKWADGMQANGSFTASETDMLKQMIAAVPERPTMVHCDYHAGNVMYQRNEIIVIDMADIGYGHPIFDLAGGAFHARYSYFEKRQRVHGMVQAEMLRFWDTLLRFYFKTEDEKKLQEIKEMCEAFGLLRGALFPMKHVQIDPETKAFHVEETRKYLFPRMDWAMQQVQRLDEFFEKVEV